MHATTHTASAAVTDLLDPSFYPRTYRVSTRSRVLYLLLSAVIVAASLAATDAELRRRGWELSAMLVISLVYAYGAILEANALLDQSRPQVFETTIVGKHKSGGKTTTYYLRLKPWGPREEEDDVSVSSELYDATAPGQRVCVVFRKGALEIPWFVVSGCGRG
jgi:uncharacterized membrane protein